MESSNRAAQVTLKMNANKKQLTFASGGVGTVYILYHPLIFVNVLFYLENLQ